MRRDEGGGLDLLGEDRAHARLLVARQCLDQLDGALTQRRPLGRGDIRQQPADLGGELLTHLARFVPGKQEVGLMRRAGVGGHERAGARIGIAGEVIEHFGLEGLLGGELAALGRVRRSQAFARFLVGQRARMPRARHPPEKVRYGHFCRSVLPAPRALQARGQGLMAD